MNILLNLLIRALEWSIRFIRGTQAFGILGAVNVFIISNRRYPIKKGYLSHILLKHKYIFYFRRGYDYVMTHFYETNYYIDICNGPKIKNIIDAGANIGVETLRFQVLYPNTQILSIEAEPGNFTVLSQNFLNNKLVTTINGALWSKSGELLYIKNDLEVSKESFSVTEQSTNSTPIQSYSLNDLLKIMNWEEVDILKIDIEGAEYEVFTKNTDNWIDKIKCLIFEVPDNDKPGSTQAIYNALSKINFNTYICGENLVLIRSDLPWVLRKQNRF